MELIPIYYEDKIVGKASIIDDSQAELRIEDFEVLDILKSGQEVSFSRVGFGSLEGTIVIEEKYYRMEIL